MPMPADFAGKKLINYKHMVFMNAVDGRQQEWAEWYDKIHSPEMLTGAAILSSQRTTLALPAANASIPPTREMVMFTVQIPEGLPANSAAPKLPPPAPGTPPGPQDGRATRGYTYREIGPLLTHAEALAKKAKFKD